jgi:hypothetical protein
VSEEKEKRNYEKEYDYLREEIMHHKKRQNQYSTFTCTAVITILGGAAALQKQWVSLLCFLIILPSALKSFESRYSIALLSTYMRLYLEPHVGIRWETNLSQYYDLTSREWHEKIVYRLSKYDFFLYSLAATVFYWMVLYQRVKAGLAGSGKAIDVISILKVIDLPHNWIALLVQVGFMIVILAFTQGYFDYKTLKDTKLRKWKYLQCMQVEEEARINTEVERRVQIREKEEAKKKHGFRWHQKPKQ